MLAEEIVELRESQLRGEGGEDGAIFE